MTALNVADQQSMPWRVSRLSGLSVALEVLLELNATLGELLKCHSAFGEACSDALDANLYPQKLRHALAHEAQRLVQLREATLKLFSEVGEDVLWGCVRDDRSAIPLPFGMQAEGFDRSDLIRFGKKIIGHLGQCQGAVAAFHIAADNLCNTVALDDLNSKVLTESAETQYEALDCVGYWAMNYIDKVRGLRKAYSMELDALQQAEDNKTNETMHQKLSE